MAREITHVYLRLSAGALHSQVDFDEIETLTGGPGSITIEQDIRDDSVYSFILPRDIDATRLISALTLKAYVDEAWQEAGISTTLTPQVQPE